MGERLVQVIAAGLGAGALITIYVWIVEGMLRRLSQRKQASLRPWLWITPALVFLFLFLIYPTLNTAYLSLFNGNSTAFVGLENYGYVFSNADTLIAIRNNISWIVVFIPITVILGVLMAVLTDRVRYERIAKAILFLPMAISFVAASVIWKFMYDYRPPGMAQTGTLNALFTTLIPNAQPQAWLINPDTNNLALIFAGVWMLTGFCVVILSAGLKGIPVELLEAARVDGATERQVFVRITLPLLLPTIAVVITTMAITALKAFDIVFVLTSGNYNTDVLATRMYKELFTARNFGHASAIAIVLLLATVPIMLLNVRNFRQQEASR